MSSLTSRIAALNDQLRMKYLGGTIVVSSGVAALDDASRAMLLDRIQRFDAFTPDNDPYGEHDFGSVDIPDLEKVFWKIDYYNPSLTSGSDDPANARSTHRVLTIMLASEY